jgi:pimeloyl-ACP methyl ester carboxylesterase
VHANASSSSQWRALMQACSASFHVLAADSFGAGRTPAWQGAHALSLRDEVALLEPVFARAGDPFSLVAHSYGAAVALVAAVSQPNRIRSLALYEPTLFAVVDAESPPPNEADGIRDTVKDAAASLEAGDREGAARRFIDFWMEDGAWDGMPDTRKAPILASIAQIRNWGHALFSEPIGLAEFSRLNIPVLYMMGKDSPASARAVARLLTHALPQVQVVEFQGVGHMGPITHPDIINGAVLDFLKRTYPA